VPDRAPVEFRGVAPASRTASTGSGIIPPPVAAPRIVDVGVSPTGTSAIDEAKALRPEYGARPGGSWVQPKDTPSARRIEVQRGDTLYEISRRYSVNMRALIETNSLEPPYALEHGKVIYLPPPNIHVVQPGETLYSISRRYNVDTRSLALLNGMSRPWTIWPGDELLLPALARDQSRTYSPAPVVASAAAPAKTQPAKPAPAKPAPAPARSTSKPPASAASNNNAPIALTPGAAKPAPSPKEKTSAPPPQRAVEPQSGPREFIWPVSGPVLKGFGAGPDGLRNDGVNIGVEAGAKVKAAAAGEVVYAGDELVGFGNLILIRHPGGWVSAYAHSDRMLVKEGEMVAQGQAIAEAGSTGNASSPQVHFELRKGKEPVDPTLHLPPLRG
jgi:murein DD-endopeptidase MepM/ murein hydrolase activator NlpD